MPRQKRNNTKKMMKGGVWYNPFTWTTSEKPNENSLENSTSVIPSDQVNKVVEGNKQLVNSTVSQESTSNKQTEIDPATGKPKKPWYQFWGGKTKKSKSKSKTTRKARK
jgi:hypothetical protein